MTRKAIDRYLGIGENIRSLRKASGYTQKGFSEKIGIPVSSYSNYENGNRVPDLEIIQKIASALNVQVNEILGTEKDARPVSHEIMKSVMVDMTFNCFLDYAGFTVEDDPETQEAVEKHNSELDAIYKADGDPFSDEVPKAPNMYVFVTDQKSGSKYKVPYELWKILEDDVLEYTKSSCMRILLSKSQRLEDIK